MNWRQEVIELHEFFQAYFLGHTDSLVRAEDALHADFTFVGPGGDEADRQVTIDRLRAGHAHSADLSITTSEHAALHTTDDIVVARYVEGHEWTDGRANRRLSTVIFLVDPDGPNGLRWLRVHETWIEPDPPT